ncbi:Alpha-L-fucosidase [Chitinophaga sp. YR573]|uniref:alpha-L-fucosidase n=1 Tax=Chitinophaga sp. YR573 TaxID=1881040 RepID=UPI0008C34C41|nr:alpha-L-fucosidase [Chitinophaga sp. YR573]SEW46857.1 Alpha-L-fucosidase [Chitinophaga sp. YR573]
MVNRIFLISLLLAAAILPSFSQRLVPNKDQINWSEAEMGVIIHLDINIFAPETFDYARKETLPSPDVFTPSRLNTDQWVRTAKAAGAKYAVLTVKHGTGFCLWPSAVNPYNIGHTKWHNGKGDILKDFIASCKKYGLKPGLYYNTNTNTYYEAGRKPFVNDSAHEVFKRAVIAQLAELWSNYGPMFEIWFDGGLQDGLEPTVLKMIREKQPHAILFQGPLKAGNTVRWIGNEDGIAAYPQWSTANEKTASDGIVKIDNLHGDPDGQYWCPGESDFPIRRNYAWNGGWLWRAGEDKDLFSVNELIDKYYKSIGRNTNMLIGMVVDTGGLIPRADSLVFDSLGKRIKEHFSNPLAIKNNVYGSSVILATPASRTANTLMLMEDLAHGEQILAYSLQAWIDGTWKEIATGESVGHKRLQEFLPVASSKFRLLVTKTKGKVYIKSVALY